jgi:hypothetical protein
MLYTYMKSPSSTSKSNAQTPVIDAWIGPQHEDLYILTLNEDRFWMPEVTPFDIACWAMSLGQEVFIEEGHIALTQDHIRQYATEHRRYWQPLR